MATFAINKRAKADYKLLETFDAGIKLSGAEVKSVKGGGLKLTGSYVTVNRGQLQLTNAHIAPYKPAGVQEDYDPKRSRQLLVKKSELRTIAGMLNEKGLTLLALKAYSKKNLVKLEIAVARGKKQFEKRESIKKSEDQRSMRRALRERNR